jgi:hypothetical protein
MLKLFNEVITALQMTLAANTVTSQLPAANGYLDEIWLVNTGAAAADVSISDLSNPIIPRSGVIHLPAGMVDYLHLKIGHYLQGPPWSLAVTGTSTGNASVQIIARCADVYESDTETRILETLEKIEKGLKHG